MLIDSGSELNMMVLSTQAKLELPMDPSGKDWILRGVSGHQVNLVGLCHDVPIQVGGVPLPHNFFITSDNIGQKDIILGQPWLFSYSARIEYAHGEGMNLQVWKDGDREGRSVCVTLPIMSAPRNVFPIKATKRCTGTINSAHLTISSKAPEFLSSISSIMSNKEFNSKRLGPSVKASEMLLFGMQSHAIREALYRGFYSQNIIHKNELEQRFTKMFIQDGYSYHQAVHVRIKLTFASA
ncbi:hypothetical protein BS47DRAFT_1390861 [Hydnum rufescens UP504]|uniref:Peptidase A2 domain-containing protein n=1 Tax=Hydnum rufescens UP504 TaxID=1448309 RepID=A0A9P6B4M1_9AGAM|nr:hypothetical protein BS47DRAFT_1390861 [Hydnum rufescens UP504]